MKKKEILRNCKITIFYLLLATLISYLFFCATHNTRNTSLIYVLAIVLIARSTSGYHPGVIASVISMLLVNILFTFPYGQINFTLSGYPITFIRMLQDLYKRTEHEQIKYANY